jgi:hypothetical protein
VSRRATIGCLGLAILLVCGLTAHAQTAASASIVGRVIDPQSAVVAGGAVTVRNVETGIERATKTTSDGLYRLDNLAPGTWDVTITAANFAKAIARGVHLNVGDVRDLNFTLQVASANTTVEVTTQMPLIETTKTDVSTVVNESDMARLPVTASPGGGTSAGGSNINDFTTLAVTAPGVRYDQTGNNSDLVGPGSFNNRGNLINIDGGNIIDQVVSTRDAVGASVDEIKEFQVLTNNYNAEYGQAGGLIINAITKSGTNTLHGDFHFFARGRNFSASNKFYNLGLIQAQQDPVTGQCPTPDCSIQGQPRAAFFKHETGFTLGGPFIKNRTFWFVSYEKLLQGSPLTLLPPSQPALTVQQPDDEVMWSAKIDHHLTNNNMVTVRFNAQRLTLDNQLQTAITSTPDALISSVIHDHTLNMALTSTLTPHLVNEARLFWHREVSLTPTKSDQPGVEGPDFYFHGAFCCPQGAPPPGQNRYQGIENVTWIHGTHTVRTGANISYFPYITDFAQAGLGLWDHDLSFSVSPPTGPGGANPPTGFTIAIAGAGYNGIPGRVRTKDNIYGFYVQDTWKLRPNLTMNYGLRWDYEAGAFKGGPIPDGHGGCFQRNGIIPACSSDKNNFQPRIGLAWSPRFDSGLLHKVFGDPERSLISASFGEMTMLAYLNLSLDSLDFDGVTLLTGFVDSSNPWSAQVFAAWPARPSPAVLAPCFVVGGSPSFGRVRPISSNLHNPEIRHVNLSWQREFAHDVALNFQYIGAFGFGQFGEDDSNWPIINADPAHPGFFYFGDRPDQRFGPIRMNANSRTSQYNGGIIDVTKRMSHHFQIHAGYTYSHTIASTEDFYVSESASPGNTKAERADAQLDVRHASNIGMVVDTEKWLGGTWMRHIFNDWSFGIVTQLQSGRPYPISTGDIPFADSRFPEIGNETFQRPSVNADGTLTTAGIAAAGGTNYLISPNGVAACQVAGQPVCPTANTFLAPAGASALGAIDAFTGDIVDFQQVSGNLKRNAGRTGPFYRTDLSVTRSFHIPWREGTRVELRADFFNLFNRANYQGFNANNDLDFLALPALDANNFASCTLCINPISGQYMGRNGQVLHLSDLQHGRVSQNLLNPVFGDPLLGIGDPSTTELPREIQVSIRVRF